MQRNGFGKADNAMRFRQITGPDRSMIFTLRALPGAAQQSEGPFAVMLHAKPPEGSAGAL
jgi:hypothetical protein